MLTSAGRAVPSVSRLIGSPLKIMRHISLPLFMKPVTARTILVIGMLAALMMITRVSAVKVRLVVLTRPRLTDTFGVRPVWVSSLCRVSPERVPKKRQLLILYRRISTR